MVAHLIIISPILFPCLFFHSFLRNGLQLFDGQVAKFFLERERARAHSSRTFGFLLDVL